MEPPPAQKVNGLIDGLAVLSELATSEEPVAGKVLSERLSLSPVRVSRLLKTLAHLGLTRKLTSRKYAIGPGIHVLAAQSMAASGLLSRSLPILERLCSLERTVALGVLWRDTVCYLFHHTPGDDFPRGFSRQNLYAATNSSIGLALLAEMSDAEVKSVVGAKFTPELSALLTAARENGYAAKRHPSHVSMAVPVGDPAYAGLAISGIRDDSEIEMFRERLTLAAAEIAG